MVKIPSEVKTAITKTNPICVATANIQGVPNLIYMTYLKVQDDETIILADNKFHKTRNNLDSNPVAAITAFDHDTRKSYQIKGRVECITGGKLYQEVVEWVHTKHPEMTPKAAFILKAEEVYCGAERIA